MKSIGFTNTCIDTSTHTREPALARAQTDNVCVNTRTLRMKGVIMLGLVRQNDACNHRLVHLSSLIQYRPFVMRMQPYVFSLIHSVIVRL